MFVAKILQEVDAQLERLQTARNTIADLIAQAPTQQKRVAPLKVKKPAVSADAAPVLEASPQPEAVQEAPAEPVPMRRRGRPKGSRNLHTGGARTRAPKPAEPTALARVVSAGPVFVSAAELDRQRKQPVVMAAPKPAPATPSEGSLESLVREIAARRIDRVEAAA